jgi:hypothetical protein
MLFRGWPAVSPPRSGLFSQISSRQSGIHPAVAAEMRRLVGFPLSTPAAYRILLVVGLPAVFALVMWLTSARPGSHKAVQGEGDLALFRAVVNAQRIGQSYYEAYGAESRRLGYPTRSLFNWRQPLLLRTLALLPNWMAVGLFVAVAAGLLIQAHFLLRRELLYVLTVLNAAAVAVAPGGVYFTESWAGLCLGLSAIAYARRRETTGAGWALLALFIRELAGPYCVVAVLIALSRKRWRELGMWLGGSILYGVYLGTHVWQVMQHVLPADVSHGHSWLYFGGLPFVLKVWQWNGLLTAAPAPIFSLVVVAGVVAWWAERMPLHVLASLSVYSVLFLFVGLPFNAYWGELIAPLVGVWLAYAPIGLTTLWSYAQLPRALPELAVTAGVSLTLKPGVKD